MRYAGLVLGIAAALLFSRLGVWQLDRLHQRRAHNALLAERMAAAPLDITSSLTAAGVPLDSLQYRRARAAGVFDFSREFVDGGKSYRGAPGVHLLTPLRVTDGSAILVDRGWAFAPDAQTVAEPALVEPDSAVVEGVLVVPAGRRAVRPDTLRIGYPLFPLVLRRTAAPDSLPAGLAIPELPALDEGPHLSYAVQWFSFAAIALVGGMILGWRRGRTVPQMPQSRRAAEDAEWQRTRNRR
jgi:surfeit locus 1 family protein